MITKALRGINFSKGVNVSSKLSTNSGNRKYIIYIYYIYYYIFIIAREARETKNDEMTK